MREKPSTFILNDISRKRLVSLASELSLSQSAVLRVLIANAWKQTTDTDSAGVDPLDSIRA